MQKKPDGLPDPNKREGPVATAKDIYEEGGLPVSSDIMQALVHNLCTAGEWNKQELPAHNCMQVQAWHDSCGMQCLN